MYKGIVILVMMSCGVIGTAMMTYGVLSWQKAHQPPSKFTLQSKAFPSVLGAQSQAASPAAETSQAVATSAAQTISTPSGMLSTVATQKSSSSLTHKSPKKDAPVIGTNSTGNSADLNTALAQKYGAHTQFTVSVSSAQFAQGSLGSGKWWLAAKTGAGWKVVADGYSYVDCGQIAGYQFPSSIVPACWSASQNTLVNR